MSNYNHHEHCNCYMCRSGEYPPRHIDRENDKKKRQKMADEYNRKNPDKKQRGSCDYVDCWRVD